MSEAFLVSILAVTIRAGTSLLYATVGEIFTERSGILNLGVEGIMIMGSQPIAENSIMQLSLVYGDAPAMSIGVESLWSQSSGEASHWTGFYIIDISEDDLRRIRDMANT